MRVTSAYGLHLPISSFLALPHPPANDEDLEVAGTLPYPTLPYPPLPSPTLPYPTLPYPTLPYPTLPYPTLPYPLRRVECDCTR
jgi:hypothetical protein